MTKCYPCEHKWKEADLNHLCPMKTTGSLYLTSALLHLYSVIAPHFRTFLLFFPSVLTPFPPPDDFLTSVPGLCFDVDFCRFKSSLSLAFKLSGMREAFLFIPWLFVSNCENPLAFPWTLSLARFGGRPSATFLRWPSSSSDGLTFFFLFGLDPSLTCAVDSFSSPTPSFSSSVLVGDSLDSEMKTPFYHQKHSNKDIPPTFGISTIGRFDLVLRHQQLVPKWRQMQTVIFRQIVWLFIINVENHL